MLSVAKKMVKAILLDIEGTTTPIDFVHKTLFPFAKDRIDIYIRDNFVEIGVEISQLEAGHAVDIYYSKAFDDNSPESVSAYLEYLIDQDRKSTPLKSIQGKIWKKGYESGELVSQVFDDVPAALANWKNGNKKIAIYSSGSVLAQKLIFKYSDHGDLTLFIDSYFDTNTGHKRETESYERIADKLGLMTEEILFISDITEELDAALAAGLQTALAVRNGNTEIPGIKYHTRIESFSDLSG